MNIQQSKTSRFMGIEDYRKLPHLNYSACKDFDESRTKFYRRYILQEPGEDKRTASTEFGDLLHCLLFTPETFDDKFAMLGAAGTPKPQMKAFADNLWDLTKACMSEDRQVTRSMSSLMQEAFDLTAFDRNGERVMFKGKNLDYVIEKFPEEAEEYYRSKRDNFGKTVINIRTREAGDKAVSELHANPVTRDIFSIKDNDRYVVHHELAIVFGYEGQTLKAMCDKVIVDHKEKKILIYDLKSSGWDIGTFEYNLIKNRYYLQFAMYYKAVSDWAAKQGLESYQIVPMQFIVVSSDMSENPLIYTTSHKDLGCGLKGFTTRLGKVHKGLEQILTEIVWHTSYGIWNMSYTDYQKNGIRKVSLFDEL